MAPFILLLLYIIVAAAPLMLSYVQDLPSRSFSDEIASGLGMVAASILLVEFLLSGRFKAISGRLGMDVTMRFHQLLARTALAFALLHPFLYTAPFLNAPLPWDVTGQLTLGLDLESLVTGVIVWIALPGFVLMSIYRDQLPYRYETWRILHGLGALAIAGLLTHHMLVAGRYSGDPLLAGFWFFLLFVALATLIWSYLIAPMRELRHPYEVTSIRKIALKTWELTLRSKRDQALDFEAGQFAWLNLGHSPFVLHENPFSISSAPAQRPDVQFVIKEAGDFTRTVGSTKIGTVAYLDAAHGNLTLKGREATGIALIAGGVGIAPLIAIARQLDADGDPRPVILLYGNRIEEQIVYQQELDAWARKPSVRVVHVISEPGPGWSGLTGQVNKAVIDKAFSFEGAAKWLYLVCGPPAMLEVVEDALVELGVPAKQIVSERFYYD